MEFEEEDPEVSLILKFFYLKFILILSISLAVTYVLNPSWFQNFISKPGAKYQQYLKTYIEPMELKAIIIQKHQIKSQGKYSDVLQLNDNGKVIELFTSNLTSVSVDNLYSYDIYKHAQVNDSLLKNKGTYTFVLVHKGKRMNYYQK